MEHERNGNPPFRGSVVIVGAGIAGLSTAILLQDAGYQVTVLERSLTLADGAGITIQNRGVDVLQRLGVLEECCKVGFVSETGNVYDKFFDSAGNPRNLPQIPGRPADGLPSFLQIYRPTLAKILAARAEALGATIEYEKKVVEVSDEGDSVRVQIDGVEDLVVDFVVGADGSNSRTREKIFGKIEQIYSGNMSLRWVTEHEPIGSRGFYIDDRSGPVVVSYPEENVIYVASGVDMENRELSQDEAREVLRRIVSGFTAETVQNLLPLIKDEDPVIVRPYTLHNLPAPWHQGRVVLVGDAAHTVSAHLGIGGVLGLEDAAVLAEELEAADTLEAAFERYGNRRAIRTFSAVDACRQMLELQVRYGAHPSATHRIRVRALQDLAEPF